MGLLCHPGFVCVQLLLKRGQEANSRPIGYYTRMRLFFLFYDGKTDGTDFVVVWLLLSAALFARIYIQVFRVGLTKSRKYIHLSYCRLKMPAMLNSAKPSAEIIRLEHYRHTSS